MARTTKSTSDLATRKVWNEQLFRDFRVDTYWNKFSGTGAKSPIQEKMDLTSKKGDETTFTLVYALNGVGVTGNTTLKGQEEQMLDATFKVPLERYRHGVVDDGDLHRRRPVYDVGEEMRDKLKTWGQEKYDKLIFAAYGIHSTSVAAQDPTIIFYNNNGTITTGTNATTVANAITTSMKINSGFTSGFGLISALRTWAETGGGGQQTPLKPILVDGEEYYVLLVHPDALYDLKINSVYQEYMKLAQARSKENPLFKNAAAIIDGVVIHAHKEVFVGNNSGVVRYCRGALIGAQSMCVSWGQKLNAVEEMDDYDEFMGYAVRMTVGVKKPKFSSKDYGSIGVYMNCSAVSSL